MALPYRNTILLKGHLSVYYDEAPCATIVSPGMLLDQNASNAIVPHGTANVAAAPMVAIEDALQGKAIEDAYAVNDPVRFQYLQQGNWFQGVLTAGQNVIVGDKVSSGGNGKFIKTTGANIPIARVMEAKDLTTGGVDGFVVLRVI